MGISETSGFVMSREALRAFLGYKLLGKQKDPWRFLQTHDKELNLRRKSFIVIKWKEEWHLRRKCFIVTKCRW